MSSPVPVPLGSWYDRNVVAGDTAVAALVGVLFLLTTVFQLGYEGAPVVELFPTAVMIGALVIRRTAPRVAVGIVAFGAVLQLLLAPEVAAGLGSLCVPIAVHAASRYTPPAFGWGALALSCLGAVGLSMQFAQTDVAGSVIEQFTWILIGSTILAGICAGSYILGKSQLARQRAIEQSLAAMAEHNRLLRSEHEQSLRLVTEQERGRLAAETHDIIAHSLAVIVAQADGALMASAADPARAEQSLRLIAETSREALSEVRAAVASLRRGDDPTADTAPARGLADLPSLVESVSAAGAVTTLVMRVDPRDIPPGVGLSAYRIVQESLTNVLKHAGQGARATVHLATYDGALQVTIRDDGSGPGESDGAGYGLLGMRTRVAGHHGSLWTGPGPDGGFEVRARLAIPPAVRAQGQETT